MSVVKQGSMVQYLYIYSAWYLFSSRQKVVAIAKMMYTAMLVVL